MKRTSLFLTFIVTLLLNFNVFGAERLDLKRDEIPTAKSEGKILNKLNILYGTDSGLELDREITRAEAVALLFRVYPEKTDNLVNVKPIFTDLSGHWAEKEVSYARELGIVHGVTEKTFAPDRTVSGKEFTKMLLCVMGYSDTTTENAFNRGRDIYLLANNFNKSVVYNDYKLLRGDVSRIIYSGFLTKCSDESMLKDKLVNAERFKAEDFNIMVSEEKPIEYEESLCDNINKLMPKDKNYMFSPLSIKMALALACNGASGETKEEILKAVGINDINEYNEFSKATIEKYQKSNKLTVNIANSIWINKDKTENNFSDKYKATIKNFFYGEAFLTTNSNAVSDINKWVKNRTNERIPSIINNNNFSSALINAIYFKGVWENKFDLTNTKKDIFTNGDGKKVSIDFMNQSESFNYYERGDIKIVELPYRTSFNNLVEDNLTLEDMDISMYLVMSDKEVPVEGEINYAIKNNKFKYERINLSLPKFKIEYSTELNNILNELGIKSAFNPDLADFKNMFNNGNMFISNVLHKTYIDVDENGTEAAAVTAILMQYAAIINEPISLKFDRPFYFAIRDNISGEILFMGRFGYGR